LTRHSYGACRYRRGDCRPFLFLARFFPFHAQALADWVAVSQMGEGKATPKIYRTKKNIFLLYFLVVGDSDLSKCFHFCTSHREKNVSLLVHLFNSYWMTKLWSNTRMFHVQYIP
jgi:hypothetical protein